jgi:hypothetical protein
MGDDFDAQLAVLRAERDLLEEECERGREEVNESRRALAATMERVDQYDAELARRVRDSIARMQAQLDTTRRYLRGLRRS